jgi:2-amino-4-hydroxy-6-hydroxymethyldihydropteridine diphosphokinase
VTENVPHPAPQHHLAAIALGSNLGDRAAHLAAALTALAATPGIEVIAASSPIETDPVSPVAQSPFLNAAALVRTTLSPQRLLEKLLQIEQQQGRVRDQRWGPRTLDLDLITFGDLVLSEPGLTLPHPRLRERRFVLEPLAMIAPDLTIPPDHARVQDLLAQL